MKKNKKYILIGLPIIAIIAIAWAVYYFVFLPKARIAVIETATKKANDAPENKYDRTTLGAPVRPLSIRSDSAGDGHFNSSRGARTHEGVDFLVNKGDNVYSPVDGTVERFANPYPKDLKWKGLYLKGADGIDVKIFYIEPKTGIVGKKVKRGDVIGVAQKISDKYSKSMRDHIHVETWVKGKAVNPEPLFVLIA